jgi:sterol desaturase/sphingolipid hydroxylase (fatty acid hydroxylase superfamily)
MEAIVNLLIPVVFVLMLVLERVFPARPLPRVRGWLLKGIVFFALAGVVNTVLPPVVASVLGPHVPWSLAGLGTLGGALVGIVATDLVSYWIHRAMHTHQRLWRWTHQMHHSAERVDIAGASYFHPLDLIVSVGLASVMTILVGASTEAAVLAGFAGFLMAMVQHMNIVTPTWLGYLVQRPESHSLHHQRGIHAYNYGGLAVWDLAFGTFRNPRDFSTEAGFWDGASREVWPMLIGRDVARPRATATR